MSSGESERQPPARRSSLYRILIIVALFIVAVIAANVLVDRLEIETVAGLQAYAMAGAVLFWCIPALAWSQRDRLGSGLKALERIAAAEGGASAVNRSIGLFVISFVVLFVEMMLIRYIGSQTRIFAFYKNIPLIGAFFGLGLGCLHGRGGRREALVFLAGIVGVAVFFSTIAQFLGAVLSLSASIANSEHMLGNLFPVAITPLAVRLVFDLHIGLYCVAVFLVLAFLFAQLGRILAVSFEEVPRLRAYSINICGSLAGVAVFALVSRMHTPPWLWFMVGLTPLLAWLGRGKALRLGVVCILLAAVFVAPHLHYTVWSSYQKLTGRQVQNGYAIDISDAFYQKAYDLSPAALARPGVAPKPNYDAELAGVARLDRVLIVGAGSGNDVAAALRADAKHVDAVDIDSAIIEMGRQHHPERPYDNPRVTTIVDDARNAFKHLPPQSYDAVVFGLLDSHTQLGISSVRLDNYVFTQESFSAAAELLRPNGTLVLSAATAADWFRDRYRAMLGHACGAAATEARFEEVTVFRCQVANMDMDPSTTGEAIGAPVDDWPFPYLPDRGIPLSYIVVIAMLVAASLYWLRRNGIGTVDVTPLNAHLFFLGAAFLLMEVYAINRLALVFGTTWLVSAVSVAAMLVEIVFANLVVGWIKIDLRPYAYVALALLLLAGWMVGPEVVLGRGTAAGLVYALFLLSPVFCAGMVFATSFAGSANAGTALGANILGAVLGGWAEYATMATGIRAMALVALALYAASAIALWLEAHRRSPVAG
jgi:SAM-dependent methyltransferase